MRRFKLLTWNIRQGGRKEIKNIVASLLQHGADLIVLTEFRENAAGHFIKQKMHEEGWSYIISSNPPGKENGLLFLSAYPLEHYPASCNPEKGAHRWETVYLPDFNFYILGVHVPNVNETYDKMHFWERVIGFADSFQDKQAVIIGDFNTVMREENPSAPLKYSNYIYELQRLGWIDSWKAHHPNTSDYTWYSHRQNGFRLDYIFISRPAAKFLHASKLSQQERLQNYSDHALMIAELWI